MDEIYSPEPESTEGKISSLYPSIGLLFIILLPWISFIKMVLLIMLYIFYLFTLLLYFLTLQWTNSGANFSIPEFLLNNTKSKAFPYFLFTLILMFFLIISAWVFLSIFQTLGFLTILSSSAFVLGHRSFKSFLEKEAEEELKEKEKNIKIE